MPHDRIRWGIVGTGKLADSFAEGLRAAPEAELVALGSRSKKTAEAFGARHSISHRHGSYAALAEDPEVDVAYIATPHTLHFENSARCLQAGKPVLCEKPLVTCGSRRLTSARSSTSTLQGGSSHRNSAAARCRTWESTRCPGGYRINWGRIRQEVRWRNPLAARALPGDPPPGQSTLKWHRPSRN